MSDMAVWPTVKLGDIAEIEIGRTPLRSNPDYWTDDLTRPFCTIADMSEYNVHPRREGVTELAEKDKKAKRVPAGALLLSFKLTLGRVAVAAVDLFPNEAIAHIKVRENLAVQAFVAYALQTVDFDFLANDAAKGKTLNKASLAEIEIPCPDLATQERVVAELARFDDLVTAAAEFAASAKRTRDAAMWGVMTDPSTLDGLSSGIQGLADSSTNPDD